MNAPTVSLRKPIRYVKRSDAGHKIDVRKGPRTIDYVKR